MHPYRSLVQTRVEQAAEPTGLPLAFAVLAGVSVVQVVTDLGRNGLGVQTVIGGVTLIAGIAGLVVVQRPRWRTRWPISNS